MSGVYYSPMVDTLIRAEDKVAELTKELVELQKQLNSTLKALEASQKARAELWDALYEVEYVDTSGGEYPCECPSCGSRKAHRGYCQLAAVLKLGRE